MNKLKKYGFALLAILSLLVPFAFYSSDLKNRKEFSLPERVGYSLLRPVEKVTTFTFNLFDKLLSNYIALKNAKEEANALASENKELKIKISLQADLVYENERLKKLLQFAESSNMQFIPAKFVAGDSSYIFRSVRLNVGKQNGVEVGMPAVTDVGVVGVVSRVASNTCDVLLINDPNSSLDVIVTRNRRRGVMQGSVSGKMTFRFSDRGSRIQVGDEIITSGLTGSLPRGIPVGKVVSVEAIETRSQSESKALVQGTRAETNDTSLVIVEPFANPNGLNEILILKKSSPELALIKKIGGDEWFEKSTESLGEAE
jgi:rod shape-determining protein MreC